MGRNSDWSPVAWGDPTPGDPEVVLTMGRNYVDVADAIEDAARTLRNLAGDEEDNIGDAIEKFVERADQVADDISRAETRYRATGEAMKTYAPKLSSAQSSADSALTTYRNSDADEPTFGDSPELKTAKSAVDGAEGARDSAARTAIGDIEDILESGDLKDGFWDNCGDFVKALQKWASNIAAICGIAALLVGWIPVIGQALAAVLGAIALVATVVSLVCNIMMMANGEGDWLSLGMDVLSLATFGLARSASAGIRGANAGLRGSTRTAATAVSRGRTPIRTLLGSRPHAAMRTSRARNLMGDSTRYMNAPVSNFFRAQRGVFGEARTGLSTLGNNLGNMRSIYGQAVTRFPAVRSNPVLMLGDDATNLVETTTRIDPRVLNHSSVQPFMNYSTTQLSLLAGSSSVDAAANTFNLGQSATQ